MLWWVPIAAAEPVERVLTTSWVVAEDGTGTVPRGKADGVALADEPLRVYRIADGLIYEIAQVKLTKVRRTASELTVVSGGPVQPGDRVEIPVQVELPPTPQWGFDVALRGLELVDGETELNRWRDWARRPDRMTDEALCAELAPRVRERWAAAGVDGSSPAGGRFGDRTVDDVMRHLTPDEACYALAWETREPDPAGRREAWTLVHGWVANGGPQGAAELLGRIEREDDEALAETLRGALPVVEEWPEEVRWAAAMGDWGTEERLLSALARYDAVSDEANGRWLLPMARAESARERGAPMVALPLYEEALALAPEAHRSRVHGRIAVCHTLVGAYEQAWPHFEAAEPGPLALEYWGQALVSVGRVPEGLAKLDEALLAWQRVHGPPDEPKRVALVQLLVGETLVNQYRPDEAYPFVAAAYAWAAEHDPGDTMMRVLMTGGMLWSMQGDDAKAAAAYEQAYWTALRYGTASDVSAFAWLAGQFWWVAEDRERAMQFAQEAVRVLRDGSDPVALSGALTGLAEFELQLGDVDAAVALYQEGRAVVADEPRWTIVMDQSIGRALADAGREAEAQHHFERAIATARELGDPAVLGGALVARAGNSAEGDAWLAEAIELYQAAGRAEEEANAWRIRSLEATNRDAPDRGLAYADAAVAAAERSGNPFALLRALLQRGAVLRVASRRQEALADYERALPLAQAWPAELAELEIALARTASAEGRASDALRHADRADATGEADSDEVLELRATALASLGRMDEAISVAQRRRDEAAAGGYLYDEAYALAQLASLARISGDGPAAVSMMRRSLAIMDRMVATAGAYPAAGRRLRIDLAGALVDADEPAAALVELERAAWPDALPTELGSWQAARGRALAALGDPGARDALVTALEHARADGDVYAIDDALLELAALSCAGAADEAQGWLDQLVPTEDVHVARRAEDVRTCIAEGRPPAPPVVAVASPARDADDRLLELNRDVLDLRARLAVDRPQLLALPAQLAPDEAVVVPVVLPDAVVTFVARSTGVTVVDVAATEADVHAAVAKLRAALQSPGSAWPTRGVKVVASAELDPSASARALHDLVIAPIRPHLDGVSTLIFAPAGRLRYVPFAALTDGERFLIEEYRVGLLTSSGARAEHRPLSPDAKLLVVSNPDGTLPGATAEGKALHRTWGRRQTVIRDGAAATEAELLARLDELQNEPNVLHLATHGILRSDAPRDSYLVLAGDERLTLREITLLPLRKTELVVLSACETAVGEAGGGEEIAGLAYQFEVRGAAAIVASLWAVDDASTSQMMMALYDGIEDGRGRADALRDAQLALLSDPRWRHPYFWAPFVLVGEWR